MRASDTLKLLFYVENSYRVAGANVLATLCDEDSPFAAQMRRLGFIPGDQARLYLKEL